MARAWSKLAGSVPGLGLANKTGIDVQGIGQEPIIRPEAFWCRFGLRDPCILSLPNGSPVLDRGWLCVFFNGRDRPLPEGGRTRVGRAWLSPCLSRIEMDQDQVFADGDYTAQGSVIHEAGLYVMYYSHGTDLGFKLAVSTDGQHWKSQEQILLNPEQFGCTRIGLPFVTRTHQAWLMFFEGIRKKQFRIFAAWSEDGQTWEPACGGQPIYTPAQGAWDAGGQANPSLATIKDRRGKERYILLYNGHAKNEPACWDIGARWSEDPLSGGWKGQNRPILCRKDLGLQGGRLEGPRLLRLPGQRDRLLFFALPGKDSYRDGAVYCCEF